MRRRPTTKFHPLLERIESKRLPSAGPLTMHASAMTTHATVESAKNAAKRKPESFLGFRVTNPSNKILYVLNPPFQHVLVQTNQPVAGQTYNLLQIAVRNGTSQTFTANTGFTVRLNTVKNHVFPVLTGSEVWKPKQVIVFYLLTKKYYPLPQTYGGFQFDLGGRSTTLVPGPSAIFVRLHYNPATFSQSLDQIVAYGQGNQIGKGAVFGIPNTSINNIVATQTRRNDFGGHF